jgi:divalent metal cation (Fe/Co/Zn/Cd) transporter
MAKTKKIVRREWTKDDVRQMKAMAKAKSGVKKISRTLKRTPGATSVMAAKLGVSLSMRSSLEPTKRTGHCCGQSDTVAPAPHWSL